LEKQAFLRFFLEKHADFFLEKHTLKKTKTQVFLENTRSFFRKTHSFLANNCSQTKQKNLCFYKNCVFTKTVFLQNLCFFKSRVFFSLVDEAYIHQSPNYKIVSLALFCSELNLILLSAYLGT